MDKNPDKRKTKLLTVDSELHQKFKIFCASNGISMKEGIDMAIKHYIQTNDTDEKKKEG